MQSNEMQFRALENSVYGRVDYLYIIAIMPRYRW